MAKFEPVKYQGPETTYKPSIGDLSAATDAISRPSVYGTGYANIDYLKEQLDKLIQASSVIYEESARQMQDFALKIDAANLDLVAAHNIAYPGDTTPDSVTFDEYLYILGNGNSNASQYVLVAYENAVRGPSGSNAIDVFHVARVVNNEAKRIKDFIETYIGDVDDASEYRVVEVLQDWTEEAVPVLQRFWQVLKGNINAILPSDEIDKLDKATASQSQALFQVKVNTANGLIRDSISALYKNWDTTAAAFFDKHLGPSLGFQLNVGRTLPEKIDTAGLPVLSNEIASTMMGLNSNFMRAVADQIKRNNLFQEYSDQILANVVQRDTHASYIRQLSQVGSAMKKIFTDSNSVDQADEIIKNSSILESYTSTMAVSDNLDSPHSLLSGVSDDDAHPQYLLRSGGLLTGDVDVAPGVKIGGMVPHTHAHTGTDGTAQIRGADIEYNSITDLQINNVDPSTEVPIDVEITAQIPFETITGDFKVSAEITFTLDDTSGLAGFEFEIVKLD